MLRLCCAPLSHRPELAEGMTKKGGKIVLDFLALVTIIWYIGDCVGIIILGWCRLAKFIAYWKRRKLNRRSRHALFHS
jgi:hypothetical protein